MIYEEARYRYRDRFSETRFNSLCLEEFALTFRSVCVDGGYYRFPDEKYLRKLADAVPDHFRFTFKVTDEITIRQFPRLPRFGPKAGLRNPDFLNPARFAAEFAEPLRKIRDKVGVLIFEFSKFYPADFSSGREFVTLLDTFLGGLPVGWRYGVEIRNKNFLVPEYFDVLRKHGVAHVYNQWTHMPPVAEQLEKARSKTAPFTVARFLLTPPRTFQEAVTLFQPYTERKARDPEGVAAAQKLIRDALNEEAAAFLYVNNRFEGSAPLTIQEILAGVDL